MQEIFASLPLWARAVAVIVSVAVLVGGAFIYFRRPSGTTGASTMDGIGHVRPDKMR